MKIFCNLDKKTVRISQKQQEKLNEMIAYHGSKANFDEFNLAYMGSGIGAQEFGEGLYLTFDKEAAYGYGGNVYTVDIPKENEAYYIFYDQPISDDVFSLIIDGIINDRKLQYPDEYTDEESINELKIELYDVLNPKEGRYLMYNIHRYIDDPIVVSKILKRAGVTGFIYNNGKVNNVVMFSSKDIRIIDKYIVSESKNYINEYFTPSDLLNETKTYYVNMDVKIKEGVRTVPNGNKNMNVESLIKNIVKEILTEHLMLNEATLDDIYTKYYNNIPQDIFWQIVKADPTYNEEKAQKMGKYGKWLLNLYKSNKLKTEDLYKATDYLSYFVKYYNKIENKDINQIPNLPSLFNIIKPFKEAADNGQEMATSKSDEIRRIKEDAEKFYEDDTWLVVIPHTQEASCYYGKNTQWCTAATEGYNMFNQYYKEGLLYININKTNNKKYQFHFESNSFMDETDEMIGGIIANTIGLTSGLLQAYANKCGGRAVISLTKPIDWDEDEPIEGENPYFLFRDYDGWYEIVKVNNIQVEQLRGLEIENNDGLLTEDNQPEYIGNGFFAYYNYNYVDNEWNDDEFEEGNWELSDFYTIYDAKTQKIIGDNFYTLPMKLNNKYYENYSNGETTIYDANTFNIVCKINGLVRSLKYMTQGWKNPVKYSDDIVTVLEYIKNPNKLSNVDNRPNNISINRLYNIVNKQFIQMPFETYTFGKGFEIDGKTYFTIKNRVPDASGDFAGRTQSVVLFPDGSISKPFYNDELSKYSGGYNNSGMYDNR